MAVGHLKGGLSELRGAISKTHLGFQGHDTKKVKCLFFCNIDDVKPFGYNWLPKYLLIKLILPAPYLF